MCPYKIGWLVSFLKKNGLLLCCMVFFQQMLMAQGSDGHQRISLNNGWRFMRYTGEPDKLMYDERPPITDRNDSVVADSRPTEPVTVGSSETVLKKWILPSANHFIKDPAKQYQRPAGNPGGNFPLVQNNFKDQEWQLVNLPHDWAIDQPFYTEDKAIIGGGMGRLPVHGVAWYRKKISISPADKNKIVYLDIDGAMSYAMVWCNGQLVGGWPYGYNSFRLNLTPFLKTGADNQIAIRIDNPTNSARWYPGAGLYRNVWLTKLNPVHIAHWGSFVQTSNVSKTAATIDLQIDVQNASSLSQDVKVLTTVYTWDAKLKKPGTSAGIFPAANLTVAAGNKSNLSLRLQLKNPLLWGPLPDQKPHRYVAVTKIIADGKTVDVYSTVFGIRKLEFHPVKGLLINDRPVRMQGVNQHHDLGAIGAAFNIRAAERQLEILQELGCNAIRMAHNPPAPELLDLTDQMGILVIDEVFDSWERKKTPHDFHLIFPDWYEADTRSFIRRDRNHPSIIAWSFGNEVGEQYTADTGAVLARKLYSIVKEEDPSRPATASMNYAKPHMPFPQEMDIISLNYQGEGIRDAPAYSHLRGIKTNPQYPAFHEKFPDKLIVSSETASALSTRGTYIFPVSNGISAPVSDSTGGDPVKRQVSAYELYTAAFGSSADKVFASQDKHPFVAGEFVWSGWDYMGEPTPYYSARSSYCGIIDLAGFKKDRFYLYQSRWKPSLPMVHILPHWNWPDRIGKITPVHVFTSGDEAELFLNGKSLGKKKKGPFEYRLRWDDVLYEPGTLTVKAYRNGKPWAGKKIKTTGPATQLQLKADRTVITADGTDLSFITLRVLDATGNPVPDAGNKISFSIEGAGEIVATDNGDPADLVSFVSKERVAYAGLALVIVKSIKGKAGAIKIKATAAGMKTGILTISAK